MEFVDHVFLPLYEIVHDVSIDMVEAIPEEDIDVRPYDTARTFREQIVHMATVEKAFALGAAGQGWGFETNGHNPDEYEGHTSLWNLLLQNRDEVVSLARAITDDKLFVPIETAWGFKATPAQLLVLARDHTNNHNGKLAIYLRLAGAEPPFYLALREETLETLFSDWQ